MNLRIFALVATMGLASLAWADSPSGFEIRLDGGLVSPVSSNLYQAVNSSYSFGGALGYQMDWISISLDAQYHSMNINGANPASSFNILDTTVVEKARFGALTAIRPFVFLGEGLAFSSVSGYSTTESDPLVKGGVGLDFMASDKISIFLQAEGAFALSSNPSVSPDTLTVYLPIQMGVDFVL